MAIQMMELEMARGGEPFDDYLKRLIKMGVERLGKGASASVFQHPKYSKVVVKVGLQKKDSEAFKWLKWCAQNTNPYAPKVYSAGELDTDLPADWKGPEPKMFIAFMEKLTPADLPTVRDFFGQWPEVFPREEKNFWGFENQHMKQIDDPDLLAIMKVIDKFKHCDFKTENVMMRGKQLVFTDPVF